MSLIAKKVPKKMKMPLKWFTFYKIFLQVLEFVITFDLCYWHFHFFLHFSVHPFQRHVLFPFLWHLVGPSISQEIPLQKNG